MESGQANKPPNGDTYRVYPSGRVVLALRSLVERATAAGLRQRVLDALKDLYHGLSTNPQDGEPLRDLKTRGQTVCTATFPPLVVNYAIDEPNRQVFILVPIKVLPRSGF